MVAYSRSTPGSMVISTAPRCDQFFGVDDRRHRRERNRAAGVAGAAAARDDGQSQFDAALDQAGHFIFGVRREHDEGIFDAPVGGVGHVRDALDAVEADVVLVRVAAQHLGGALAQVVGGAELLAEVGHRACRPRLQQLDDVGAALARGLVVMACVGILPSSTLSAALVHLGRAGGASASISSWRRFGLSSMSSCRYGLRRTDPDIAQHFVQHAGRTAGLARAAQFESSKLPRFDSPSSRMTISRSENDV